MDERGRVGASHTLMIEIHLILLQLHLLLASIDKCSVVELGSGLSERTSIGQICTALLMQKILLLVLLLLH